MIDARILIVEDDPEISGPLAAFLDGKRYHTRVVESAEAAQHSLNRGGVDLLLLDVMLPGESGLDFCRRVHSPQGPRIIMLTSLAEPMDKIVGLELGADDYITKPVDLRELQARIRAVLRRNGTGAASGRRSLLRLVLKFAGFTFHPYRRLLRSPTGVRIPLTGAESDLLLVLCERPRQALSREELIELTRGTDYPVATRSVDLLISRLRRKLTANAALSDPIHTVRMDGYALQAEVTIADA